MNPELRNFPKPPIAVLHADCGLGARTEIVAKLCERTNEIAEYLYGLEEVPVPVPAQSNVDERMPLMFLRPCINVINAIIHANGMEDIEPIPMPGDNMDYHGFVPLTRTIAQALNEIIEQL